MFNPTRRVCLLPSKLTISLPLSKLHKVAAMTSTITTTTTRLVSQATKPSSPSTPLSPPTALSTPTAATVPLTDLPTLEKCVTTLSSAFSVVPCTNAFAAESNQTVHGYVTETILESIQSHGGVLVQAADASAVALWEVPVASSPSTTNGTTIAPVTSSHGDSKSENSSSSGDISIKQEWKNLVHAAKEKYIGIVDSPTPNSNQNPNKEGAMIKPHYHLDFLARNPAVYPKIPGAITAVVRPYFSLAKQEGRSVWLEATSLDVVPVYEYFGFKVMEEILVGKGKVDRSGRLAEGGEGVRAWLMVIDNPI
ncbi:hypothetical protein V8F06_014557 [Rhypophila decipiens]